MESLSSRASISSRPLSFLSHSGSALLGPNSNSTSDMLPDTDAVPPLDRPVHSPPHWTSSQHLLPESQITREASSLSLTINYLPTKFSSGLLCPNPPRHRKRTPSPNTLEPGLLKQGGGVDAFKTGVDRIPGQADEDDEDGIDRGWFGAKGKDGQRHTRKLRWNRFKWMLFIANTLLSLYSLVALVFCLLTWFDVWVHADVVRVGNRPELVISTLAATMGIITSVVGWSGILLNNRCFLAIYTFLLWITFAFLVVPGYISYKRRTFNLEGKINAQWSRELGLDGRMRIQNQLNCCGYFNPFVEATITQTCYSRSPLPGCKARYTNFERVVLERWYTIAFSLVPLHLFTMVVGLLCSNHVTYRFGKGMMPKAYRLSLNSMAVIMENYASQLAEEYGPDVAYEALARSRSTLQLDKMPLAGTTTSNTPSAAKYDTISESRPETAL